MSHSVQQADENDYGRKHKRAKGKILKQHVDTEKVNLPVLKVWLEEEMQKHLPDDDIAVEFIYEMLEGNKEPVASEIQEQLVTFLGEEEGRAFCQHLWQLLISGQQDKDGIPEELLEKRKQQMEQQTRDQAKAMIEQIHPQGKNPGTEDLKHRKQERWYERPDRRPDRLRRWPKDDRLRELKQEDGESRSGRTDGGTRREDSHRREGRKLRGSVDEKGKKTNYNRSTRGTYERDDAGYRRELSTPM